MITVYLLLLLLHSLEESVTNNISNYKIFLQSHSLIIANIANNISLNQLLFLRPLGKNFIPHHDSENDNTARQKNLWP